MASRPTLDPPPAPSRLVAGYYPFYASYTLGPHQFEFTTELGRDRGRGLDIETAFVFPYRIGGIVGQHADFEGHALRLHSTCYHAQHTGRDACDSSCTGIPVGAVGDHHRRYFAGGSANTTSALPGVSSGGWPMIETAMPPPPLGTATYWRPSIFQVTG